MEGVAVQWMSIGLLLGVSYEALEICEASQGLEEHVNGMVVAWLNHRYNWERFGEPSWRRLVEVIGARAGGNNRALSQKIARLHPVMAAGACILLACDTVAVLFHGYESYCLHCNSMYVCL